MSILDRFAYCQTNNKFLRDAADRLDNHPAIEKVYLHLDESNYDFSDTIWYNAYLVVGEHHELSALSGVLHVELINPKDSVVVRQTLTLASGVAWGDIPLPSTLKQGSYRLRAYTNWMRNFDPDYFYERGIRVGGIEPVNTTATPAKPDVQFFPEGGKLVNDLRSRVAVKSVGTNGLGQDIKGTIEDREGNVIADFSTQHLGMGVFAFTPQSGKTYKAKISAGETGFTVDLPKAQEEGFTLALNNSRKDSIYIKVAVNENTFNHQKNSIFYIIGQNSGKVYYTTQGKLEGLVYTASVEKDRFPTGISQFTLFSQSGEPLAERIAFIQTDDTLKLHISPCTAATLTRQPVKISLSANDRYNKPVTGSFSVSVINETLAGADDLLESTILNNVLLTSDLKGYIEQPNYYFSNTNEQTRYDLDVLMLTQGYRRYEWKQMLTDTTQKIAYQPERSLTLTGTLKTPSGKPVPHGSIALIAPKENVLRDTTADVNGSFRFTNINLADSVSIVLKARKANKNDNVIITLNPQNYPQIIPTTYKDPTTALPGATAAMLQKKYTDYEKEQRQDYLKNGIQLRQVNIHGYTPPKKPDLSSSYNLNGPGHADQVIMGTVVQGTINLSDALNGRLLGVKFTLPDGEGKRTPYLMRDQGRLTSAPPMAIIVDGIVMTGDHLDDLDPNNVYSIEILRSGAYLAIYGSDAYGGAMVITMKHGGEDSREVTPKPSLGLMTWRFAGYNKARAFYTPKYSTARPEEQVVSIRSTIYWNPNLLTDKDGKTSFDYFNNDTKGTYRVVVEGIDDEGNLGRAVFRYKVE